MAGWWLVTAALQWLLPPMGVMVAMAESALAFLGPLIP